MEQSDNKTLFGLLLLWFPASFFLGVGSILVLPFFLFRLPPPPSIHFFTQWYNDGLPSDFWLPGFFFTQSFLTGALQNYARKYKLPIDTLEFDYFISNRVGEKNHHNDVVAKPDDGVIVWGCVGPRMYHCFVASLMQC
jgi:hypothetical protein